ncbi:MAG: hypothetical protein IJD85_09325, partial [Oscillospiraceae bacterium]|nr:hypothetical protein [Oscillospiraceae bacterium]
MQHLQLTYTQAADDLIRGAEALGGGAESNIFVVARRESWPENSLGFVNEQNQASVQISKNFNRIYSAILGKDFDAATAELDDVIKIRENVLIDGKPIEYEPKATNFHSVLGVISMAVAKELAGVQNMKTDGALLRDGTTKPVSFTLADTKEPLFVDMKSYTRDTSVKPRKPSKPNIFKRIIHALSNSAFKNDFDRYERKMQDYNVQMEEYNKRHIYDRLDAAIEARQKRVEAENKAWRDAENIKSLGHTDDMIEQFVENAKAAGLDTSGVMNDAQFEDNTIIGNVEFDEAAYEFEQMKDTLDKADKEFKDI